MDAVAQPEVELAKFTALQTSTDNICKFVYNSSIFGPSSDGASPISDDEIMSDDELADAEQDATNDELADIVEQAANYEACCKKYMAVSIAYAESGSDDKPAKIEALSTPVSTKKVVKCNFNIYSPNRKARSIRKRTKMSTTSQRPKRTIALNPNIQEQIQNAQIVKNLKRQYPNLRKNSKFLAEYDHFAQIYVDHIVSVRDTTFLEFLHDINIKTLILLFINKTFKRITKMDDQFHQYVIQSMNELFELNAPLRASGSQRREEILPGREASGHSNEAPRREEEQISSEQDNDQDFSDFMSRYIEEVNAEAEPGAEELARIQRHIKCTIVEKYLSNTQHVGVDDTCSICLAKLIETKKKDIIKTSCNHYFCADCITDYIAHNYYDTAVCPLCRKSLGIDNTHECQMCS
jgi:hypothetical protein